VFFYIKLALLVNSGIHKEAAAIIDAGPLIVMETDVLGSQS
jgi:hypothetical protein